MSATVEELTSAAAAIVKLLEPLTPNDRVRVQKLVDVLLHVPSATIAIGSPPVVDTTTPPPRPAPSSFNIQYATAAAK